MNKILEVLILEKIQELIEFTYATGYYAGSMEHGKFTQEKDKEYTELLQSEIKKRQSIQKEIITLISGGN